MYEYVSQSIIIALLMLLRLIVAIDITTVNIFLSRMQPLKLYLMLDVSTQRFCQQNIQDDTGL